MYFDAVIDYSYNPIFNGTREETLNWIADREELVSDLWVALGDSTEVVPVPEYLGRFLRR